MDVDGRVLKAPGELVRLRRAADEPDATCLATALAAVDVLRDDWQPLTAEAVVVQLDEQEEPTTPVKPHWRLAREAIPTAVTVRPLYADPIRAAAPELSRAALERWLAGALAEAGPRAEWHELRFDAVRARLGPPEWCRGRDVLRLRAE